MTQINNSLLRPHLTTSQHDLGSDVTHHEQTTFLNEKSRDHGVNNLLAGKSPLFPTLEVAVQALGRHVDKSGYDATEGIAELRQAIVGFHRHFDHVNFEADDVIVGSGSKELVMLLMLVFHGDILMSSTCTSPYKAQAIFAGHRPVIFETCHEDSFRITAECIHKVVKENSLSHNKLLILKNPCSKTGTYYNEEQLQVLTEKTEGSLVTVLNNEIPNDIVSEACRQHHILVVSDENYARLSYHGRHISLSQVYPEGTIMSTGLSKWANAGGWRIGFNLYPRALASLLWAVKTAAGHSYSCAPVPMQHAFAEVLQDLPACEDYIQHTTRVLAGVGMFCVRHLESAGVSVAQPTCGYYIFPNFDAIKPALNKKGVTTCEEMCQLMQSELSVKILALKSTDVRKKEELTFSLCFANFDGSQALAESNRRGLAVSLDEAFVEEFVSSVCAAIMDLTRWVHELRQGQAP